MKNMKLNKILVLFGLMLSFSFCLISSPKLTLAEDKIQYTGNDIYFDDITLFYDSENHSLIASAPIGWTITYDCENSFKDIGEYQVSATFTNEKYETIVKSAKLTIVKKPMSIGLKVFLIVLGSIIGAGLLSLLVYKIIDMIKCRKYLKDF